MVGTGRRARDLGCAVLGAAATGVLVGGSAALPAAAIAGVLLFRVLPSVRSASGGRERQEISRDLPLALDVVAACLRAGSTGERALEAVAVDLPGPVGDALGEVAGALRAGQPAAVAWERLAALPGGQGLARAAGRSADTGAALAATLERMAVEVRSARAARAQASAGRAGVLMVLPLGLCFLPAFLLAGVAPVVLSVLSGLDVTR
jgi:pilus assembly protein TadC